MTNIKEQLTSIWNAKYFIEGQKYFCLYNYNLFRIVEKDEFEELNKTIIHPGKNIFAVADATNGDGEHEAYIYFDVEKNIDIFIQSNYKWIEPKELKKISTDLGQLFKAEDYSKILIAKNDADFWAWTERTYHSYTIENEVPTGVLPNFDLRLFFKEHLKGTFLSDHKEININAFKKYFEEFGLPNVDTESLFEYRPTKESLNDFVEKVNVQLENKVFYVVSFNPSSFWGIGNFKSLTSEEVQQLHNYGLIN